MAGSSGGSSVGSYIDLGMKLYDFGSSLGSQYNQAQAAKKALEEINAALADYPEMQKEVEKMFEQKSDIIGRIKTLEESKATTGYQSDIEGIQNKFYDTFEGARSSFSQSGFESSGQIEEYMTTQGQRFESFTGSRQKEYGYQRTEIGIQSEEAVLGAEQERQDRLNSIEQAMTNLKIQKAQLEGAAKNSGGILGKWAHEIGF